jgi:PKD repeat protein
MALLRRTMARFAVLVVLMLAFASQLELDESVLAQSSPSVPQACPQFTYYLNVRASKPVYNVGEHIIIYWGSIQGSGGITLYGPSGTYQFTLNSLASGGVDIGTAEQSDVGEWRVSVYVDGPAGCPPIGGGSTSFQVQGYTSPPSSPLQSSLSCTPSSGNAPLTVTCTSSTSGGTPPYSNSWSFGDGQTGNGASVSHTYTSAGSYQVTLTVSDSSGKSASKSTMILVATPQPVQTSFTVHVADAGTGASISGASVYLDNTDYLGTTDSNGNIRVRATIPPDSHKIEVRANGYQDLATNLSVSSVNGGTFTVRLSRPRAQSIPSVGYFEGGQVTYSNPVTAGQRFTLVFKNYGSVPIVVNWKGSSAKRCVLWVFCSDSFHAQQSIQVEPGQVGSFNVDVDSNTHPGYYILDFEVCYGSCGFFGATPASPSPSVRVMVQSSQGQIIWPSFQNGSPGDIILT